MSDEINVLPRSMSSPQEVIEYGVDACQRGVLFLDILRQRGNIYREHAHLGKPPVLIFDYEIVADGRDLPHPVNYALARIIPPEDWVDTDPGKRPFVVIDPRAGQGAGIGGFKMDSEIGIALKQGHPCYLMDFYTNPEPEQKIEYVTLAEIEFLQRIHERHPDAEEKPFMIGNCQGGWALMMLAASTPERLGPILLAGSPISYWAGIEGKSMMRYSGGLLGGSWMASFASDLGAGKFDGAYLVNNFEQMNPANTYWGKLHHVYQNVDTEAQRFLDFERWWGGHCLMNKQEMDWITQNLFIGNRLTAGEVLSADGETHLDLRNIRSPIIVFASWGDDITPPPQALNWIPDLYENVDAIRLNEQTIVYCLNDKIGHLGIFVSAGIAKKEDSKLINALDLIETLPFGLYEAVIQDTQPDLPGLEFVTGRYLIRFESREVDDIVRLGGGRDDERAFEVVKRVSEINQGIYDKFVSPWIKACANPWTAAWMRQMNPARAERWMLSDLNPAMWGVKSIADAVRTDRLPVAPDNPLSARERHTSDSIEQGLDRYRVWRDQATERTFKAIYESPWLAACVGLKPETAQQRNHPAGNWFEKEFKRLKRQELDASFEEGTLLDGAMRLFVYCGHELHVIDERPFNALRQLLQKSGLDKTIRLSDLKQAVKRQAWLVALDEARALAGLAQLIPQAPTRRRIFDTAYNLIATRGEISPAQHARLEQIAQVLDLDPRRSRKSAQTADVA